MVSIRYHEGRKNIGHFDLASLLQCKGYIVPQMIHPGFASAVGSTAEDLAMGSTYRKIDLIILNAKYLLPTLEKECKVLRNIDLIERLGILHTKPGSSRIFYPEHIGDIRPGERALLMPWIRSAIGLESKRSILTGKAVQRAASRSTVQPDNYLIVDFAICSRFEYEVQTPTRIFLTDWDRAAVEFAGVEINVWPRFDQEGLRSFVQISVARYGSTFGGIFDPRSSESMLKYPWLLERGEPDVLVVSVQQ